MNLLTPFGLFKDPSFVELIFPTPSFTCCVEFPFSILSDPRDAALGGSKISSIVGFVVLINSSPRTATKMEPHLVQTVNQFKLVVWSTDWYSVVQTGTMSM